MTDTEILEWLVQHGGIDTPMVAYHRIVKTPGAEDVHARISEIPQPAGEDR